MRSQWGSGGVTVGDVVRFEGGDYQSRLGHTWAKGRLKRGDLAVVMQHGGDHFFYYVLLDHSPVKKHENGVLVDALRLEPITKPFGSYTTGRTIFRMTTEQMEKVAAGEDFTIPVPDDYEPATARPEDFLIWWTDFSSCQVAEAMGAPLRRWPAYLERLWEERRGVGSDGTFILWSDPETGWEDGFADRLRDKGHEINTPGNPLRDAIMGVGVGITWGGIVIKASDVGEVLGLPGFLTTTSFEVITR